MPPVCLRSQDPGHTGATVHGDAQEECPLGFLGRGSLLLDAQRILGLLRQGAEGQVSRGSANHRPLFWLLTNHRSREESGTRTRGESEGYGPQNWTNKGSIPNDLSDDYVEVRTLSLHPPSPLSGRRSSFFVPQRCQMLTFSPWFDGGEQILILIGHISSLHVLSKDSEQTSPRSPLIVYRFIDDVYLYKIFTWPSSSNASFS